MKPVLVFLFSVFALMQLSAQAVNEAVSKDDTVLALQLIKGGASPNLPDENGATPLMFACRWGKIAMVKLLLANGATLDQPRSRNGRTALMVACAYYSGISIIKMLVEAGANVNITATNGTSPLMLAASNAKSDVVEFLLAKGADATEKDASGLTALDYAEKADVSIYGSEGLKDCQINKEEVVARLITLEH